MNITFALPAYAVNPIGGFKVVYEYANHLSQSGHQVYLVYPRLCRPRTNQRERIKELFWHYGRLVEPHGPHWFPVEPSVKSVFIDNLASANLPDADVLIGTGWHTAPWVAAADSSKGRPHYLIQDLETWDGPATEVLATWNLPISKIMVASWLMEHARTQRMVGPFHLALNAVDHGAFFVERPLEARADRVAMLYHRRPSKGSRVGIAALEWARKRLPKLEAILFGVSGRPRWLPAWIEYRRRPTMGQLRAIYNSCRIFIQPSSVEGWGLTSTEAMACGCALITVDNGGSHDFAIDDETAVVIAKSDTSLMADAISQLHNDSDKLHRIATAGRLLVQGLTWDRSTQRLIQVISNTSLCSV